MRMTYQISVCSLYEKLSFWCINSITVDVKLLIQHCALLSFFILRLFSHKSCPTHVARPLADNTAAIALKSLQAHFISSSLVSNLTYQKLLSWFITIIRSCFRTRRAYDIDALMTAKAKQSKAKEVFRQGCRPWPLCPPNYIEHNLYKM